MKTLQLRLLGLACLIAGFALLTLLTGCATHLRQSAHAGIAADGVTSTVGIASGVAREGNPLIGSPAGLAVSVALRMGMVEYANRMPEPARTTNLSALNAVSWGVVASNLSIIAAHSNPAGIVIGLITGWQIWRSTADERQFAALCADERLRQPDLQCVFSVNSESKS